MGTDHVAKLLMVVDLRVLDCSWQMAGKEQILIKKKCIVPHTPVPLVGVEPTTFGFGVRRAFLCATGVVELLLIKPLLVSPTR
jgi:hypothetical protein